MQILQDWTGSYESFGGPNLQESLLNRSVCQIRRQRIGRCIEPHSSWTILRLVACFKQANVGVYQHLADYTFPWCAKRDWASTKPSLIPPSISRAIGTFCLPFCVLGERLSWSKNSTLFRAVAAGSCTPRKSIVSDSAPGDWFRVS